MTNMDLKSTSTFNESPQIFLCECSSAEHQVIYQYDFDDNRVYCRIHLTSLSFWERLKYGIKYIFGYNCRYGAWEEFIVREGDAKKFEEIAEYLKKNKRFTCVE